MAELGSILVVDDSERCIEIISMALEAEGGVKVSAETVSARAIERIRREQPELVLLDIKMPDVDGFTVLSLLRSEGNRAPVVMLSGSGRQTDIDRAYALGCNGYLQKPNSVAEYRQLASTIVDYWRRVKLPSA